MKYLLSRGASLFLETLAGDSPLSLGREELRARSEEGNREAVTRAEKTLQTLYGE